MSNNKNIENFDSFLNEAFNNFEPTPPKGVFEAMQSQLGAAAGNSVATGAATKAGLWGAGKIIVGAVAALAIATTIYVATTSETEKAETKNIANTETVEQKNTSKVEDASTSQNSQQKVDNLISEETSTASTLDNSSEQVNNNNSSTTQDNTNIEASVSGEKVNSTTSKNENPNNSTDNNNNSNQKGSLSSEESYSNTKDKEIVRAYLSDKNLCANERLTITIADNIADTKYKVDFGDGNTVTTKIGKPTTHKYQNAGKYKVVATSLNNKKVTEEQWVEVSKVEAKFEAKLVEKATFNFNNQSINAKHFNWFFGDKNREASQLKSPTYTFKSFEPSTYKVKLIAMNDFGCLDSFSTYVKQNYTYEDEKPKMYNVFSPGADGKNDHYKIEITNEQKYHLIILDKKGDKVFESYDKNKMWDGRNMFTGNDCPAANYIVVFSYKINGFEERQEKKFVTLVR